MALPRRAIRSDETVIRVPSGYVDAPGPSVVRLALVWLVGWRCYTRDVGTADDVEARKARPAPSTVPMPRDNSHRIAGEVFFT